MGNCFAPEKGGPEPDAEPAFARIERLCWRWCSAHRLLDRRKLGEHFVHAPGLNRGLQPRLDIWRQRVLQ